MIWLETLKRNIQSHKILNEAFGKLQKKLKIERLKFDRVVFRLALELTVSGANFFVCL